jgi:hypothetical protein
MNAIAAFCFAILAADSAPAQDWIAPACCPQHDCQAISDETVTVLPGGFRIKSLALTIGYDDPRVMPSYDGKFHVCTRSEARPDMETTRAVLAAAHVTLKCFFAPFPS